VNRLGQWVWCTEGWPDLTPLRIRGRIRWAVNPSGRHRSVLTQQTLKRAGMLRGRVFGLGGRYRARAFVNMLFGGFEYFGSVDEVTVFSDRFGAIGTPVDDLIVGLSDF